jgi:filamentous hemagglutinin
LSGQLLPNLERAVIAIEKLRDYVLNPDHPKGQNKARVFKAVLGVERKHATVFAEIIKETLVRAPATKNEDSDYGSRWVTHHEIIGINGRSAIITVAWLFKAEQSEVPVLITCYIDLNRQEELRKLLG